MADSLHPNLLNELFRLYFLKKSLIERTKDFLKFQFLPTAEFKTIYKDILAHYNLTNSLPTFGSLYQKYKDDDKLVSCLNKIKETEIVDETPVLKQLENFIKQSRFTKLWDDAQETYTKKDRNEAIELMAKESAAIVEFSIFKESGAFLKVFGDFNKVQLDKQTKKESGEDKKEKIPFGILPCDIISKGGMDRKETVLWIMRSGVGKSTVLKWHGMTACRLGFDVLHIQLEGAKEEAYDKYTQVWTALSYHKVKSGEMETDSYHKLLDVANQMVTMNQDICIKSFEQFGEASMMDVRDTVVEYIKIYGKTPELLILDSIDLAHPGDGLKYGVDTNSIKMKIQNSCRKFKNICNEFDIRGITATQTSDVPFATWNDPTKTISRSDSMGDKSIVNSFSYCFTGNQSVDEEKRKVMRIYFDKLRYYGTQNRTMPICTNYEIGRFFHAERTKKLFKDVYIDNEQL